MKFQKALTETCKQLRIEEDLITFVLNFTMVCICLVPVSFIGNLIFYTYQNLWGDGSPITKITEGYGLRLPETMLEVVINYFSLWIIGVIISLIAFIIIFYVVAFMRFLLILVRNIRA